MATKKSDRLMAPTTICADGLRLSVRRCGHQVAAPLCDLLDATPGVLGSEIVGAGLGGSVVALLEKARAAEVLDAVRRGYYDPLGAEPKAFVCEPGAGSAVIY